MLWCTSADPSGIGSPAIRLGDEVNRCCEAAWIFQAGSGAATHLPLKSPVTSSGVNSSKCWMMIVGSRLSMGTSE